MIDPAAFVATPFVHHTPFTGLVPPEATTGSVKFVRTVMETDPDTIDADSPLFAVPAFVRTCPAELL